MKILMFTQKVDKDDDVLGIYHDWIEQLGKRVEKLSVVCLYRGRVELPENISVYSLGKEEGKSRMKYIKRFFKYISELKNEYDLVFVHMNPEYVILGGWLWRLWGKKIVLWYAHYHDSLKLRIASAFSHKLIASVEEAFPFKTKKLEIVGQGIDIQKFSPEENRGKSDLFRILFLGRISPVKHVEVLLGAARLMHEKEISFRLNIVGAAPERDGAYEKLLKKMVGDLGLTSHVFFLGSTPHTKTPQAYKGSDVFVNLTTSGSFDKTTLEAMACGRMVLASNKAFRNIFSEEFQNTFMFKERDAQDLADKLIFLSNINSAERGYFEKELREIVLKDHSITKLMSKLESVFNSPL